MPDEIIKRTVSNQKPYWTKANSTRGMRGVQVGLLLIGAGEWVGLYRNEMIYYLQHHVCITSSRPSEDEMTDNAGYSRLLMAALVVSRLTLHRSCSVCRICVWPWKGERCTWPFPYPPADTNTARITLIFKWTHSRKSRELAPHICPCAEIFWECACAFFLFNFPPETLRVRVLQTKRLTMWKMMVSSLLVISTVMADLLCAMVPMSFHLSHTQMHAGI